MGPCAAQHNYRPHVSSVPNICPQCGGEGAIDSGRMSSWLDLCGLECPNCGGTGRVPRDPLIRLSQIVATLRACEPPCRGGPASAWSAADLLDRMFGDKDD